MRKVIVAALVTIAGVLLIACARTEVRPRKKLIVKCKEAAQLITEKGLEASLRELNNKNGKFAWKTHTCGSWNLRGHISPIRRIRRWSGRRGKLGGQQWEICSQGIDRGCQDQE